jgi:glycosyltransferase involved in cell wall biosynthesis
VYPGVIRIAHISEAFVGGICTHLCTILPRLVRDGFEVTLIVSLGRSSPDAGARIDELRRQGVTVHILPMWRGIHPLEDARAFRALSQQLSQARFDIIHTHGSKAGALGRLAAVHAGCRVRLHSPHCFAFLRNGGRGRRLVYLELERLLGRLTTQLITVAPSEADIAAQHRIVPRSRCRVVMNALPNGCPAAETPRANGILPAGPPVPEEAGPAVTTVCRLVDYKGVFRFLHAARLSRTPGARFLVAGDGELKPAAQRFIIEHHLERKVALLGYVQDMESLYARSDLVVLCSDAEATPYCLLEAMRARCAIVATAVVGSRDLVTHDQTGLLVEPEPAGIARAIDDLLANKARREELTANAYARFRAHHVLDQQIANLAEIYRSFFQGAEPCLPHPPSKPTS